MRRAKILTTIAALALVAAPLAACTGDPATGASVHETPTDRAPSEAAAVGAAETTRAECEAVARVDAGVGPSANGAVTVTDDAGSPLVYEIAPDDTLDGIADRFCLDLDDLAATNYTTASGTLFAGEHLALSSEGWADARRASGYLFPACPMHPAGYPDVASIRWSSTSAQSPLSQAHDIGTPIDTGPVEGARGTVRTDAEGRLIDYTVAAGDFWRGITDRFCIDTYFVASLTGEWPFVEKQIHPDDVIPLQPTYLEIRTNG